MGKTRLEAFSEDVLAIPFATAWMGQNYLAPAPTTAYGAVLLLGGIAYYFLQCAIIAHEGRNSLLASAMGRDWKGKVSPLIYLWLCRSHSLGPGLLMRSTHS